MQCWLRESGNEKLVYAAKIKPVVKNTSGFIFMETSTIKSLPEKARALHEIFAGMPYCLILAVFLRIAVKIMEQSLKAELTAFYISK